MKLVNSSYNQCIDPACKKIPIKVLNIEGWTRNNVSRYTIQILSCEEHLEVAQKRKEEDYPRFTAKLLDNPPWLKRAQENELNRKQEAIQ